MKQTFKKSLALLLALALMCALYVPAAAADPVPADGISLDQTSLTLYRTDTTVTLTATPDPEYTTEEIEWKITAGEDVISINPSSSGRSCDVTVIATKPNENANTPYTATVTVKVGDGAGNKTKTCDIKVYIPRYNVSSLRFRTVAEGNPEAITSGATETIQAVLSPEDATYPQVHWYTTTPNLISFVDANGIDLGSSVDADAIDGQLSIRIRAKEVTMRRTAEIGVYSMENRNREAIMTINVDPPVPVTGVKLSDNDISIPKGGSWDLTARIEPSGAANRGVRWVSSDSSQTYITIEEDEKDPTRAKIKAKNVETVTPVTVTVRTSDGGFEDTCTVRVTNQATPVTEITISPPSLSMVVGSTQALTAIITPSYANNKTIKWSGGESNVDGDYETDTKTPRTIAKVDENGLVTAVAPGETTITATAASGVKADCKVTVSGVVLTPGDDFPLPAGGSATMTLKAYGAAKSITSWNWSSSNTNIARVVGGSSLAQVTGVAEGDATITVTGGGYTDSCVITIEDASKARNIEADSYFANGQLNFSSLAAALQNTCDQMTHGGTLDYIVNVTVPTAQGTLFDHYVAEPDPGSGLSSATRYYASANNTAGSSNLISNIYFVPRTGYAGAVTISYNGVSAEGNQYSGTITLAAADSSAIRYNVFNGSPVQFRASDFTGYVQRQSARAPRYVTFDLPAARYGKLHYYSIGGGLYEREVAATDKFYAGIAPSLDDVWFVPDSANRSNVSIAFHAYDSNGTRLADGTVTIVVAASDAANRDGTNLSYSIPAGERLYFSVDDFVEACASGGLSELNYIYFSSAPSSARGTMYYDGNSRVYTGSSNPFYRSGSGSSSHRTISSLYFRAASGTNATGTASFDYTGYDVNGMSFTGTIRITVTSGYGTALTYSTRAGQRVWLGSADFSDASYSATDRDIDYIRFNSLPSSSRGTLYCLENIVSTSDSFYRAYGSSGGGRRLIEDLSFVPASGFTSGTVVIPYTGYGTGGRSFTGTVTIYVGEAQTETPGNTAAARDPNATPLVYYSAGEAVPLRGADFTTDAADKLAYSLASVKFTQLNPGVGRLCTNYVSPTQYNLLDASQSYTPQTINSVYFQPKAGFSGSAAVPFFATDITGKRYSGTLIVRVTPPEISTYFDDMYDHAWAVPAVEILAGCGVVEGADYRMYSPAAPMTRGDFILMLSRAFSFPYYGERSFDDVPATAYYAPAIASAMALGIVTGGEGAVTQNVFRPGDPITREEAGEFLYRSMRRAGTMPAGSRENLAGFADGYDVSEQAVEAMSALALLGVFEGDDFGRLNPQSSLTRAEMATIFYRAIT